MNIDDILNSSPWVNDTEDIRETYFGTGFGTNNKTPIKNDDSITELSLEDRLQAKQPKVSAIKSTYHNKTIQRLRR